MLRVVSALLLAVPLAAGAGQTGGALQGTVRGGGVVVPGAEVSARQGSVILRATTDAAGHYSFTSLAPGDWTITASMPGFVPEKQAVALHASPSVPARLDFALALAPYAGPAPSSGPPLGFRDSVLLGPAIAAATPPAAFTINGSEENGAASPFAQSPAFGNHRPGSPSLYTGDVGMTLDSSALDARSYSLTGQPAPKPRYTNLTGILDFGGPLMIPHLFNPYNPPYLSVTYQKQTLRSVVSAQGLVPTPAERVGNLAAFATPIVNPATGQAFGGNQVPVSTQAAALLALYPLPNVAGNQAFNYQVPLVSVQHSDQLQVQASGPLGLADNLSATFGLSSVRRDQPNLFGFTDRGGDLAISADLRWQHHFAPGLDGTFGLIYAFSRTALSPFFAGRQNVSASAGIAGNDQTPANWGPPALNFAAGLAGLSDGQATRNRNQSVGFSFAGSWVRLNHNVSFGLDTRRLEFSDWQQQNARGSFVFTGAATGNDMADFLLGIPDAETLAFGNADKYFRQGAYDGFVTDDWRANDSLSLNLGIRWEYAAPITELYRRLVNLDIAPGFTAAAPVLASAPTGSLTSVRYPAALLRSDPRGFEPRLGLAWTPFAMSSLVVRAGYGVYYDAGVYPSIARRMAQQAPISTSLNLANSAAEPLSLAAGFLAPPGPTPTKFAVDPNFRPGYTQTWDASVQQSLAGGMLLTLAYLGNKGTHNQQEFLPNTYAPGASNPCPACPLGFLYLASNGDSTFESGEASLQRRFHAGLAWKLTYTYSHAIDDAILGGAGASQGQSAVVIAQNWRDLSAERGNSSFDQRHKLAVTAQYSAGVGVAGGALIPGWLGAFYRGWTVTSQLGVASGLPLTPTTALLLPGTVYHAVRPNLTGVPVSAAPPGPSLNPAAFALPPAGGWGDAARNSIAGPGVFSLDAGLQRSFPISARFTADLRVDATNVLNHVTFPSWDALVGSAQFGLPLTANPMRSLQTTLRITF